MLILCRYILYYIQHPSLLRANFSACAPTLPRCDILFGSINGIDSSNKYHNDYMAGYASYADFNNHRPRYDSHRQSLQDSLNETVDKPFLAPDWNKGEGTYEAGENGRRRSALVVTKQQEWKSALKRGNKGQRIVFGVFAFCAA